MNMQEPLATFRFGVRIEPGKEFVGIFTECKLPDVEWDVQELKEGGRNDYVHLLIGQRKMSKVSLKNGLTRDFILLEWYAEMMTENHKAYTKTLSVTMMDARGKPVLRWHMHDVYPTKIVWPELKTGENTIAIQNLELACGRVVFEPTPK